VRNMERRIQNPEVRIQNDNYSDSCLLTPEFFIFKRRIEKWQKQPYSA
jgi:hypothetical protein